MYVYIWQLNMSYRHLIPLAPICQFRLRFPESIFWKMVIIVEEIHFFPILNVNINSKYFHSLNKDHFFPSTTWVRFAYFKSLTSQKFRVPPNSWLMDKNLSNKPAQKILLQNFRLYRDSREKYQSNYIVSSAFDVVFS